MSTDKLPPGPPPVNGLLAQIQLFHMFQRDILQVLSDLKQTYGDIYVFQVGEGRGYVTNHPDHIHEFLVTHAAKFYKDRDLKNKQQGLARFLGNGLLTSDGEFWKRQRRLAAPALHAKRIESYAQTMVDYTLRMLEGWHDSTTLDISREMTRLTMLIVAKTLFNADVSADVKRVGDALVVVQSVAGPASPLPTWIPTPRELRMRRARRDLDDIIYRIINQRRASGQVEDIGDLLSMLLLAEDEDGQHMTDEQARDEVVTLFLAGHETTANALNWTWYLLSQNPDAEARLHDELDHVLNGSPPTLADLERLPYTEMVIKESIRLYPPAWILGRQAIDAVEIAGYPLRKGDQINGVTFFVHRDPRWWPQPERFLPERFATENESNLYKRAYLPFGGGPRICIGNSFAMMEARLLLATIASRYRLTLQPGHVVEMNPMITLNPKGGMPMILHERERIRV